LNFPSFKVCFGGLSSQRLTAVSNFGGLGSFGAHGLTPEGIEGVIAQIRSLTSRQFAMSLWVSMEARRKNRKDAVLNEISAASGGFRQSRTLATISDKWSKPSRRLPTKVAND
jgi:hypothetical protein